MNAAEDFVPIRVDVPALYCPFPAVVHPRASQLTEAGMQFMTRFGFCATEEDRNAVANIDGGNIAAHWFPDPALPWERLRLIAEFTYAGFRMDDLRTESLGVAPDSSTLTELVIRYCRVWETPQAFVPEELDPFCRVAHELGTRCKQLASPTQAARVARGLSQWALGLLQVGALRSQILDAEAFLPLRLAFGGALLMIDLVGFACPEEIPGTQWYNDEVQATVQAAVLVEALDNDLFSWAKEDWLSARSQHTAGSSENLVYVLQRQLRCSRIEAFEQVADCRNRIMHLYVRLSEQVRGHASAAMLAHLDVVDSVIAGNLHYHATGTRYTNPDGNHPHAIVFVVDITDTCPVGNSSPPANSIAWWWDQLSHTRR